MDPENITKIINEQCPNIDLSDTSLNNEEIGSMSDADKNEIINLMYDTLPEVLQCDETRKNAIKHQFRALRILNGGFFRDFSWFIKFCWTMFI